jgi:hypothetical protein
MGKEKESRVAAGYNFVRKTNLLLRYWHWAEANGIDFY